MAHGDELRRGEETLEGGTEGRGKKEEKLRQL